MTFRPPWALLAKLILTLQMTSVAEAACRVADLVPIELLIQGELQTSSYSSVDPTRGQPLTLDAVMGFADAAALPSAISPRRFQAMVRAFIEDVHARKRNVEPASLQAALTILSQVCELASSRRAFNKLGEAVDVPSLWVEVERKRSIVQLGLSVGGGAVFVAAFGLAASLIIGSGSKPPPRRQPRKPHKSKLM